MTVTYTVVLSDFSTVDVQAIEFEVKDGHLILHGHTENAAAFAPRHWLGVSVKEPAQ